MSDDSVLEVELYELIHDITWGCEEEGIAERILEGMRKAGLTVTVTVERLQREHGVDDLTEEDLDQIRSHFIEQQELVRLGRAVREVHGISVELGYVTCGDGRSDDSIYTARAATLAVWLYKRAGLEPPTS